MKIGSHVTLLGDTAYNRAGINHPPQLVVGAQAVLSLGDHVGMSGGSVFCLSKISIGNHVQLGVNCRIFDTDFHSLDHLERRAGKAASGAPVVIEDDVWLCANVTVLKGVRVGARTVVAAGSVVSSDLPPDCVAAGVPAREIRKLTVPQSDSGAVAL